MKYTQSAGDQYVRARLEPDARPFFEDGHTGQPARKLVRLTTVPISLKVLLRNQLRYMSEHFDILAVSSPGEALDQVERQEGVGTVPIAMTRTITPVRDMKALWQLYRLFRKERPVIVHSHTPKAGLLGMMAAWMAHIPVRMHTVAGLPLMSKRGFKRILLELTERVTYRCATNVYPNSFRLAAFISERRYCRPAKLKVLGNGSSNGIDMEYFQLTPELALAGNSLRRDLQIEDSDFVFVFIGRLVRDKGIEELVDAFTRLKKRHPYSRLLLVGPFEQDLDPLSGRTLERIERDESIIHVGFQEDVRPYLAISQVLVFPSYREGFPNVPMQAGCLNVPAIVTDINGCNEIIQHNENGLLVNAGHTESLYEAMQLLITDQPLYLTLKANSRKLIQDRYEQRKFWHTLLNEYHNLLKACSVVS